MSMQKILCVAGATASGKSALAVALAHRLNAEIISCDSVQIFRGFDIGSGKIRPAEAEGVPHHLLDVAPPWEHWSAGRYAKAARDCIRDIQDRGKRVIVCGGSGLWMRALTHGLPDIPPCPRLNHGDDAYDTLCKVDPDTAARLSPGDSARIGRALDVFCATGKPLSAFRNPEEPPVPHIAVGIRYPDRAKLRERIALRVHQMVREGLWEECAALLASGASPDCMPMRSLGYLQARRYLAGELSEAQAVEDIILRTGQYAKRQDTWFRHQHCVRWFDAPMNEIKYEMIVNSIENQPDL